MISFPRICWVLGLNPTKILGRAPTDDPPSWYILSKASEAIPEIICLVPFAISSNSISKSTSCSIVNSGLYIRAPIPFLPI